MNREKCLLQIFRKVSELLRFDIETSGKLPSCRPIHIRRIRHTTEADHRFMALLIAS
jgi:hypothetical protein